jgi:hypothetical protein
MRVMNDVFRPYMNDFFIFILDDILIFSLIWEDHIKNFKIVFKLLKNNNFYIKLSKCEFGKKYLVYLGYIVGMGQLNIYPTKVKLIFKWTKLTISIEVRSFLEAVKYMRNFVANLSYIEAPLHALTSVNKVFQWGGKKKKAFKTLKEKIRTALVLALPDLQKPFEFQIVARRYAMGVVLMQRGKTICYHYETFTQVVINYPKYDKELHALVQSVKKWNH